MTPSADPAAPVYAVVQNGTTSAPSMRKNNPNAMALSTLIFILKRGMAKHISAYHLIILVGEYSKNIISAILLEMFYYRFRNMRFSFGTQNVFKSHKFYEYMCFLERSGFVNICNINHKNTYYTLTDYGELFARLCCHFLDNDEKYLILREKIVWIG